MARGTAKKPEYVTFSLAKGTAGASVLTVTFPEKKMKLAEGTGDTPPAGEKPPAKETNPKELATMQQFFKGMKISMQVEAGSEVVKTSSPFKEGNKVTLFEMDFEKLLANPEQFKKFAGQQPKTLEEAKELLKDIEGLKIITENKVTIEFK